MSEPAATGAGAPIRAGYESLLASRRADATAARRSAARISNARLAVFALGVVLAGIAFGADRLDPRWLLAPGLGFIALVVTHDRVLRRAESREHSVRYYEDGIARLDARFAGRGASGERFRDPEHAYADDLDLFGEGGLFELLCRARTAAGEAMLAAWLLAPAPSDEARGRQAAVLELRPAQGLRESLTLVGDAVATGLHAEALELWGESAPPAPAAALRGAAAALSLLSAALVAATLAGAPLLIPWLAVLGLGGALSAAIGGRVRRTLAETGAPARELALLARLLAVLEGERFAAPRLVALRQAIATDGIPASREIARLRRLVDLLDARRNQLFAPISAAFLVTTQVALAIDAWRARCGPRLRRWLDAVGELEALASLAAHAYEHPDDVFPEIVDGPPRASRPRRSAIRCSRRRAACATTCGSASAAPAAGERLEHVGQEHAAAHRGRQRGAGAGRRAVCARRLVLSPLAVGASLRVHDSLQDGHLPLLRRDPPAAVDRRARAAARAPSCSCSTRSCTAPTRTTAGSAPRRWCAAWSRAERSASSPPTTSRWRRSRTTSARAPPTCTSKTSSRTARCASTTACDPAW